ncbi:hypothetical protein N7532_003008 [Penicillium argentinense]|uniref:Uncharacterized protein n=1 Tax=Penicillium argentinense TaxID=1131581 RepID=A0A9W9KDL3_9EURO|nr:uncharacterized protein N7532_003008 [Penicillium argentinense]KAJ5102479.1 hypothetical protein N7532_003008 [Penicillium argentinense]
MHSTILLSISLLGSAFAMPAQNYFSSWAPSSTLSAVPTPVSVSPGSSASPSVQAAESKLLADYSSFLHATGTAQGSLYSKLNPDIQAIQTAKVEAWSSSIPLATEAPSRH